MTDTPPVVTVPPPPLSERIKTLIGDLARPFAIYSISGATSYAIAVQAGADKIGAAGLIVAALFGAKSYEVAQQAKEGAKVDVARAQPGATPQ